MDDYYYREYKRSRYHRKRFRRSNYGIIFGVCQGLSNYTGISVGLIRFISIITFICSGFAPIGIIYLILALLIPTEGN
mgnify:CR=1 FL=1